MVSINEKSKFWSTKNELTPRDVFKSANKKFIFDCNICNHEFKMWLNHITNQNCWCPKCKNKTELKLYNWLLSENYIVQTQTTFIWTKTEKSYLKYDFYIEDYKLIIELDGSQHFKQVSNWQSPEKNKINDDIKNNLALNNNLHVIRICQMDVFFDRDNWDINLKIQ